MGKLVIQIIKSNEIFQGTDDTLGWTEVSSEIDSGVYNPSAGYTNLDLLDIGFGVGIETNTEPNMTHKKSRPSVGSEKDIPLTLSCSYLKEDLDGTKLMDSVFYLMKASKSGYLGVLYWIPNSDAEIIAIEDDQCQDYAASTIRALHDLEWPLAKLKTTDSHYGSTYSPNALPVLINDVVIKESQYEYEVVISGLLFPKEE